MHIHTLNYRRAIGVAWLFITTSCIPVGFEHGLVTFSNGVDVEETKCMFSAHEGYNHATFQVSNKNKCVCAYEKHSAKPKAAR